VVSAGLYWKINKYIQKKGREKKNRAKAVLMCFELISALYLGCLGFRATLAFGTVLHNTRPTSISAGDPRSITGLFLSERGARCEAILLSLALA